MLRTRLSTLRVLGLVAGLAVTAARAEDVEGKWRVSLGLGGFNPTDEVPSSAANQLQIQDGNFNVVGVYEDPRDDSSAFGNLDVQSGRIATLAVQRAVSKIFLVEGSVGYGRNDVGDVELSVQFLGNTPPIEQIPFIFDAFRIQVGEIERIPIQLTALARFRPRARFNPFFGGGIGYEVRGFQPSDEFNALSRNIDRVRGAQYRVTNSVSIAPGLVAQGDSVDLSGATVDVRDSFLWHLVGGAELSFNKRWAVYGEVRWIDASRDVSVGFNGSSELGVSIPQFVDTLDSELGQQFFFGAGGGPVLIGSFDGDTGEIGEGVIDAGQIVWVRRENVGAEVICDDPTNAQQDATCEFDWVSKAEYATDPRLAQDFQPDGKLDPGFHYAQGGSFSADGFAFSLGVRVTF